MNRKHALFVLTVFASGVCSPQAFAGFQWKGPAAPPPAAVAAPAVPDAGMVPLPQDTGIQWAEGVPVMPAVQTAPVDVAPPSLSAFAAPENMAGGEVLQGFGADIPLVMAAQQIIPAGYQMSFAAGADPGTIVSWSGGKPWQGVLSDMLKSRMLGYTLQKNTVVIGPAVLDTAGLPVTTIQVTPAVTEAAMTAPVPQEEKVMTIHRQKPSSFFSQFGFGAHNEAPSGATPDKKPADVVVDISDTSVQRTAPVILTPTSISQPASASIDAAPAADVKMPAETSLPLSIVPPSAPVVPPVSPAASVVPSASAPVTATAAEPVTAPPSLIEPSWHGAKGQTLRTVLKEWCDVAGVELYWSIDYDYRLNDDVAFGGTFDEAVAKALDLFIKIRPQPYGQLHQPTEGRPGVLVIKSYDLAG